MRRPVLPVLRGLGLAIAVMLGGLGAAAPANAQCNTTQLCPAGANPCNITAACTVNAGTVFDIRPRALVIKEGKTLMIGVGTSPLTIKAGSILFEKGSKIQATGTTGAMGSGGAVVLQSTTTFTMQSQGSTNSRIDVTGEISGGSVEITATGAVDINGLVQANATSPNGFGGLIDIVSETSTANFTGAGIQAAGGDRGENGASGGAIGVFTQGNITVAAPFDVSGGDCICDISLDSAAGNVTTTATGDFNLRGKGQIGDGGATSITATGTINLAGDIFAIAQGSGGEFGFGGGFGGDLDIFSNGSIVVTGRVDLDGASPDGDGGNADIQSDLDITLSAYLGAPVEGLGAGGDIFISAGRDLTLSGTLNVGADAFGGQIDATATGTATISGSLDAAATAADNFGGTISVQACTLSTTATSILDARGGGSFPSATNFLLASNTLTSRGRLLAGSTNRLDYLTTPPTVIPPAGAPPVISPAVTIVQNPALPCCVNCAQCGDGNVTGAEQCDDHNTVGGDCCSAGCQFEANNSPCLADALACTRDVCNGAGVCTHPAGNAGTACRGSAGVCDVAETCNGTSTTCPADVKSTAPCRASAGICDVAENCDGVNNACPADVVAVANTPCRASAGVCDLAETCNGISGACPADAKSTAPCRASGGVCDAAESCNGVANDCPADILSTAGTPCRASAGACDVAETCTGSSAACPADAKSTAPCRAAAGTCDVAESCNGSSNDCPSDAFVGAGVGCRAAGGVCDVAESCTGSSAACPADAKSTAPCRGSTGLCDAAESCDGVGNDCPADAFAPSTTECRASAGVCDVAETCTGSSAACPADAKSTAPCRAADGSCDVAESCDGSSNDCPADVLAPDDTACGGDACSGFGTCEGGVCTGGEPISCGACQTCDPVDGCVAAPRVACTLPVEPRKAQFQVKDSPKGEASDQVIWKWVKGGAVTAADFGNPVTTDTMDFCVFDRSQATPSLLYRARVLPGRTCGTKPCWIANGEKGFKYTDKAGTPEGINTLTLTAGLAGKSKILLKGKGVNLSNHAAGLPAPPLMLPLTVQLQSGNGQCWEANYSAAGITKNTPLEFNGKAD
ncbi:MAG TPA: hypothetical protein VGR62_25565 [Candidatus Binatia bacterium]|nr:hypothetical protein [Candidatus Binatia bacterium]